MGRSSFSSPLQNPHYPYHCSNQIKADVSLTVMVGMEGGFQVKNDSVLCHRHRSKTFGKTTSSALNLHIFFLHYPLNNTHGASTDTVRCYNLELIDTQRSMCTGYVETLLWDMRDNDIQMWAPVDMFLLKFSQQSANSDWWGSLGQMKPQLLLPSSFKPFPQKTQTCHVECALSSSPTKSLSRDCYFTLLMRSHAVSRVQPRQEGLLKQGFKLWLMCG